MAEGVTNLDAKGDGVHFISNGKDQCVKLWDMRRTYTHAEGHEKALRKDVPSYHWCDAVYTAACAPCMLTPSSSRMAGGLPCRCHQIATRWQSTCSD